MNANPKRKHIRFIRKVRPRYHKALIPALIISFIIAVILILIVRKYLFKPIFEEKGFFDPNQPVVVMQSKNLFEENSPLTYAIGNDKQHPAWQCWRKI